MIIRDSLDLAGKKKRKKERLDSAQKIAEMSAVAGAGVATGIIIDPKLENVAWGDFIRRALNAVESVKNTVQQKAKRMKKDSSSDCAQNAGNVITGVHGKTEGAKKNNKKGYHEVTRNIHETAEAIEHELNKPLE